MKVYALLESFDYAGDELKGVLDDESAAQAWVTAQSAKSPIRNPAYLYKEFELGVISD